MIARFRTRPVLLVCLLAGACVDSSGPGDDGGDFPPPAGTPVIDIEPKSWVTLPGKSQVFSAIDPVSNKPLIWTPPPELLVFDVESHSITLGSHLPKGKFELQVQSSVDPEVVGTATIQVKPYGYSGTFVAVPGLAAAQPMADVAVTRGSGPAQDQRVFLAVFDPGSGTNGVSVWNASFTTQLDDHPDQHFNPAQRPRITADAHGRAYWVEQYYDPALGERSRILARLELDGTVQAFEWKPEETGGLQLVPGTDLASDDDGNLYFMAEEGGVNQVVRFVDPFGPGALPQPLAPLAAAGLEVQLAVDAEGRLLVARGALLERWTLPAADGAGGIEFEVLAELDAAPVDLDADAQGSVFVLFETHVDVLDDAGNVLAVLASAQVGLPAKVPFEHLLGLGVDADGGLRLTDDPLVDDPTLGASALRNYALEAKPLD